MSFSSLEQWWEEWQLRILVLASLGTQLYLAYFAPTRKLSHLPSFYRFLVCLAYLGGDALAIYALAALFNRQKKRECYSYFSVGGSKDLEVLWAPILLMHLGGQIGISAYDIEDNEQWKRHLATAVSQVTVTIYVFCHSWSPLADKRLLVAAILLFIVGVFRCLEKPLALRRSSFNTIVTSFHPAPRTVSTNREVELEQYIQEAKGYVDCNQDHPTLDKDGERTHSNQLNIPDKLFVDFAYIYTERLAKLKAFWLLDDENFFKALRIGISRTFNLIFTKLWQFGDENRDPPYFDNRLSYFLWLTTLTLPIISITLFHISHKQAYRGTDIKITFLLLYITYCLEIISMGTLCFYNWRVLPGKVGQSSIIVPEGKRRHITNCLSSKGLLGQFGVENTYSSKEITFLVCNYVKDGWRNYIRDVDSYWKFTDTRGHKTLDSLERNGCVVGGNLRESIEKPLDESIILWHIATDFCFYHKGTPPDSECARLCRQISNYMMHLLHDNPEMLMPGSRRDLFTDASEELKAILQADNVLLLVENRLTQVFIDKVQSKSGLFNEAWVIAQDLMKISDDGKKMWEAIRGVWIEMLCFSAGRCRGYLHAKNLGHGGEYLTFVSLVMSHGGLETFAERQQRVHLQLLPEERKKRAVQHQLPTEERVILKEAATNQEAGASSEVEIVLKS
ncbi:hypothetical protein SETIT_6G064100v2 [Setaria italica]|uniref:DUF4220 domain-containing protein n=2 Tax=Setaria italica TaxID=4555 RepID=A0A368RJ25_SETIT|nr:uncharacterized protein LOC101757098 [Setaria italica]RCV30064.1 hypothetical protein SETIT_6G064100v2 [Setaria italica]